MSDADLSYQVFAGLLAAVLEDERISPDERERLDAYREKHRITDAQQSEALAAIGWTDAQFAEKLTEGEELEACLLYTSPSPRDGLLSRMPSSA